jgi:hypothetical protein
MQLSPYCIYYCKSIYTFSDISTPWDNKKSVLPMIQLYSNLLWTIIPYIPLVEILIVLI